MESFLKLFEDENILNYIVLFCGFYIFILWLIMPVWVFIDAKKKYNNITLATLFFILVLPLNIPGLIFYIIIRPEGGSGYAGDLSDSINIPVVNFLSNEKELVMGLELKVNPDLIKEDKLNDLNLKVALESEDGNIKIENIANDKATDNNESKINLDSVKSIFGKISNKLKSLLVLETVVETEKKEEEKKEEKNIEAKVNVSENTAKTTDSTNS